MNTSVETNVEKVSEVIGYMGDLRSNSKIKEGISAYETFASFRCMLYMVTVTTCILS